MPFSDLPVTKKPETTRKTQFANLKEGTHIIRMLEPDYKTFVTHFFKSQKATVECLGDDCPICANNREIYKNNPEDPKARERNGYNRKSLRYVINVLDKTPAKVCPDCAAEYKGLQFNFCTCGAKLPDELTPLNKVKVLSKGEGLFGDMLAIERANLDELGNVIGLMNYDITIIARGEGRDVKYTVMANTNHNDPLPEFDSDEFLFPLDNTVIKLDAEEMLECHRGTSLKDLFAARRAKEPKVVSDEVLAEVNEAVSNLFK